MRNFIVLLVVSLTMFSCKKDDVDPRDAVIGNYRVSYTAFITGPGGQTTDNGSYSLVVEKGNASNELLFTDPGKEDYTVLLNGTSFTIQTYFQDLTIDGTQYNVEIFGSGSFNGNTIMYTENGEISSANVTVTSNVTGSKQ